jgi:hypothetical protein
MRRAIERNIGFGIATTAIEIGTATGTKTEIGTEVESVGIGITGLTDIVQDLVRGNRGIGMTMATGTSGRGIPPITTTESTNVGIGKVAMRSRKLRQPR